MNDRLKEIFNQYHEAKTRDIKYLISDLESEIENLMTVDTSNYDDFIKATQLIADYGIQLNSQGYVKKSKPFIEKGIHNIELDEKLKGTDLFKDELYLYLVWTRGQINHTLKNYKQASNDFKALVLRFPENDKYKNWYNGCVSYWSNQTQWFFVALIFLSLFANYVIGLKSDLFLYLDLIGVIGFSIAWIYKISMTKK